MPAMKVCARCPTIIDRGTTLCSNCAAKADKERGTATQRGYTSAGHLKRFRPEVLARDPICKLCMVRLSTVADHHPRSRRELVALGLDPDDPKYGRGLCKQCHDRETSVNQPGGWNRR